MLPALCVCRQSPTPFWSDRVCLVLPNLSSLSSMKLCRGVLPLLVTDVSGKCETYIRLFSLLMIPLQRQPMSLMATVMILSNVLGGLVSLLCKVVIVIPMRPLFIQVPQSSAMVNTMTAAISIMMLLPHPPMSLTGIRMALSNV